MSLQETPSDPCSTSATVILGTPDGQYAQSFRTGSDAENYGISEVDLRSGLVSGGGTIVRIKENDSGRPGDLVATLTNPASLTAASVSTFTAPAGTILDSNTNCWITINEGRSGRGLNAAYASGLNETSDYGRTVGNESLLAAFNDLNWTEHANLSIQVEISGTGRPISTDATLSGLSLVNDSGSSVALSPGCSSDEFEYDASVGFPVSQITVAPTIFKPGVLTHVK